MCRPVQMGFKANFHVKNSARFRKSLRLTRADRSVWQALVSRAPPLTQRQDGSVQMCNKTAPAGILLLLFSFMPRGDDMETKGSVCSVLSTRGNMAHYTCRCSNYANTKKKKEGRRKKWSLFYSFCFLLSLLSNVCQVSLERLQEAAQPFIISSHLDSSSF